MAMGGFDTLYHHELTERLAWRPSQAGELRLHGVRNLVYAVVFVALGWSEPRGAAGARADRAAVRRGWSITLWDFVEEDRTRKLPASERVTHTLLTLNYGVMLAMLVPLLLEWAALPTAIAARLLLACGAGSAPSPLSAWSYRDCATSPPPGARRRLAHAEPAPLAAALTGRRTRPRHRRHRLHRPPPGRGAGRRRPRGHRADARAAPRGADLPAPLRDRHVLDQIADDARDRRHRQPRRRADRQRPVDARKRHRILALAPARSRPRRAP